MLVLPDLKELIEAHELRAEGRVAGRPTMYANVPSVLDPDMGNGTGRHVLSIEVLYTPYSLAGGWEKSSEPRRWLDMWAGLVEGRRTGQRGGLAGHDPGPLRAGDGHGPRPHSVLQRVAGFRR